MILQLYMPVGLADAATFTASKKKRKNKKKANDKHKDPSDVPEANGSRDDAEGEADDVDGDDDQQHDASRV